MVRRILDIVDMQVDFMHVDGLLAVPDADRLIARTNDFFRTLPRDEYQFALFKYDTHFAVEYPHSPESQSFPHIHCEYGTKGWTLAVDDGLLADKLPVHYMTKNCFDMWADNPVSAAAQLEFAGVRDRQAYANLFHVTNDRDALARGVGREEFFAALGMDEDLEVTMLGVASDFCVHDAMLGYLQRGARVRVIGDLVTGIGTNVPGRAPSGHIADVLQLAPFKPYADAGMVSIVQSAALSARS